MNTQNDARNRLILIAAGGSALLLAGAYLFQALGYPPCKMCWWQRYGHFAAVALAVPALGTRGRFWPLMGALAVASSAAIGFYHSGVERKWWDGPASCTSAGNGIGGMSIDTLLDPNASAPHLVLCDQIPWRLSDMIHWQMLDITMANLNAVASLVLALIWVAAVRRSGRNT